MRSSDHYLHEMVSSVSLCGMKSNSIEEVVKGVAKEIGLVDFKPAQLRDLENELLRIDEVCVGIITSPVPSPSLFPEVPIDVAIQSTSKNRKFVCPAI